jgi:hypothetical protein
MYGVHRRRQESPCDSSRFFGLSRKLFATVHDLLRNDLQLMLPIDKDGKYGRCGVTFIETNIPTE